MNFVTEWKRKRYAREENALFEEAFAEASGQPTIQQVRGWNDFELHEWISSGQLRPAAQSVAESELRFREAMKGPAGKAVRIARISLVLSLVSLGLAIAAYTGG